MADDQGPQLVQSKEVCTTVSKPQQYLKAPMCDKYHNSDAISLYIKWFIILKRLPFAVYTSQPKSLLLPVQCAQHLYRSKC